MGDEFIYGGYAAAQAKAEETAILFDAIAVAGLARTGAGVSKAGRPDTQGLTTSRVDELRTRAEQQLPQGHDLRRLIVDFATQYEEMRHNPAEVKKLGMTLHDACHELVNPAPARPYRADIDG